mmetsp:Transcript_19882/g.64699  ORF Transcript_19882/g.64699 Transcript_19882/m.64699 type:complete len:269 (-) Transcript_19882:12-818(-)
MVQWGPTTGRWGARSNIVLESFPKIEQLEQPEVLPRPKTKEREALCVVLHTEAKHNKTVQSTTSVGKLDSMDRFPGGGFPGGYVPTKTPPHRRRNRMDLFALPGHRLNPDVREAARKNMEMQRGSNLAAHGPVDASHWEREQRTIKTAALHENALRPNLAAQDAKKNKSIQSTTNVNPDLKLIQATPYTAPGAIPGYSGFTSRHARPYVEPPNRIDPTSLHGAGGLVWGETAKNKQFQLRSSVLLRGGTPPKPAAPAVAKRRFWGDYA